MTKQVGTLTAPGSKLEEDVKRHEHHKIIISVSNFVSDAVIRVEDVNDNGETMNLDELNRDFTLSANGTESYLIANMKMNRLKITFVSGDATLNINYVGW